MSILKARTILAAAIFVMSAATVLASDNASEPVNLVGKRTFTQGELFKINGSRTIKKHIVVTSFGRKVDDKVLKMTLEAELEVYIAKVDEEGAVRQAKFRIVSCDVKDEYGLMTALPQGTVLTVSLNDIGESTITKDGELLDDSAAQWVDGFTLLLDNDHGEYLNPGHEVSPGESWPVDAKQIAAKQNASESSFVIHEKQIKGNVVFDGVRKYPNSPLYEISYHMDLGEIPFPDSAVFGGLKVQTNSLKVDSKMFIPADNHSPIVGHKESAINYHRLVDKQDPNRMVIQQTLILSQQYQRMPVNTQLGAVDESHH